MSTWWERLAAAMTTRNLSAEMVAQRSGVKLKSLYGYLQGEVDNPRGDTLARLAASVGVSERYLRYGEVETPLKRVPLISMDRLRALKANDSPLSVWDNVSTTPAPIDVPEDSFGVTISDDANAPEFKPGDVVICSPSAAVEPGRYVLAVREEDGPHFGRYRLLEHGRRSRFALVHDNTHWPDVPVDDKHKGFVVARAIKHIRNL